jgi:Ser-tRNA(Ala) deacylase AlaX
MVNIMGVECPCGGTHVEKVAEVGKLLVTKVAKKGKNIRVSYSLPDK